MTQVRVFNGFAGVNNLSQLRQNLVVSDSGDAGRANLVAVAYASPYGFESGGTGNINQVAWRMQEKLATGGHRLPHLRMHNASWASAPTGTDPVGTTGGTFNGVISGASPKTGATSNCCVQQILPYVNDDAPNSTATDCTFRTLFSCSQSDGTLFEHTAGTNYIYSLRIQFSTDGCPYTGLPMNTNNGSDPAGALIFQIHNTSGSGPDWSIQLTSTGFNFIKSLWNVAPTARQTIPLTFSGSVLGSTKPLNRWINLVFDYTPANSGGHFRIYGSLDNDRATTELFDWADYSGGSTRTKQAGDATGPMTGRYHPNWIANGSVNSKSLTVDWFRLATNEDYLSDAVQPWAASGVEDTTPPTKPVIVLSAGTPDTTAIDATESTSTDDTGVTDWRFYKQTTEMIHNPDLSVDDFTAGDGDKTTGWQRNTGTSLWTIDTGEGTLSVSGATTGGTWTEPDTGVATLSVGDKIEVQFDYAQSNGVGTLAAAMGGNPDYTTDPTDSSFVAAVQGTGSFRGVHEITDLTFYEFRFRPWDGWNGSVSNINLRKLVQDGADEAAGAHSYESLTEATLYRMNVQTLDAAENESAVSDTAELATVDSSPPVDPLTASPYSEDAVNKNSGPTTHTPIADGVPAGGTAPYFSSQRLTDNRVFCISGI